MTVSAPHMTVSAPRMTVSAPRAARGSLERALRSRTRLPKTRPRPKRGALDGLRDIGGNPRARRRENARRTLAPLALVRSPPSDRDPFARSSVPPRRIGIRSHLLAPLGDACELALPVGVLPESVRDLAQGALRVRRGQVLFVGGPEKLPKPVAAKGHRLLVGVLEGEVGVQHLPRGPQRLAPGENMPRLHPSDSLPMRICLDSTPAIRSR
eukprot:3179534-Pyramimonas_sp.AAC.2